MAYYKVYLTLSALVALVAHATNADYEYERLKALSQLEYRDIRQAPWNSQYESYEAASSELLPHYDSYEASEEQYGSSLERFPISGIKKEPNEDKSFKKSSFYAPFVNKDSLKHKELALNSKTAYCQEIKVKSESEPRKGITTCYRCKDPKTKSTFERCLYKNEPEESVSASRKVEHILPAQINFRYRRSSSDVRSRNPYRFADEYFSDATQDFPAAYENKDEKCDKIVKDSMVCMLCKNPKTNSKYEQCSYVKQPLEKEYSYHTKSSNPGKPQEQNSGKNIEEPEKDSYTKFSSTQVSDRLRDHNPSKKEVHEYPKELRFSLKKTSTTNEQDEVEDSPTTDCKEVQKDSKTCTVCKDSKTGGTYEKCSYNYQPSDKLYKYSRSKSFGYPKSSVPSRDSDKVVSKSSEYPHDSDSTHKDTYFDKPGYSYGSDGVAEDRSESDSSLYSSPYYSSKYSRPEGSSETELSDEGHDSYDDRATSPSSHEKSASERHSEDIDKDLCKTIQKDSMTCTVCKDPKNGNDFEQCSYSYQPTEKLFSYSESSAFGNPRENDDSQERRSEEELPDGSEIVKGSYEPYTPGSSYKASTKKETKSEDDEAVGPEYLNTAKKKAEIEGFLQKFQKKDRSKCKKVMRDKMTCYQCVDDEGFQKEECVFVTGREPDKEQLAFHEIKEFQVDPASSVVSSTKTKAENPPLIEPIMSGSKNSYVRLEKPDNDYPDEASHTTEETKGVEPYDYTSETQSTYNKVLGMTLPAYMLTTSEHEEAFDEVVASSYQDER